MIQNLTDGSLWIWSSIDHTSYWNTSCLLIDVLNLFSHFTRCLLTLSAVDCILGDWEPWTGCDKECGWGKKSRKRAVLRPQQNGGKPCGTSLEKSFCYGWNCIKTRHSHGHHELQGMFS